MIRELCVFVRECVRACMFVCACGGGVVHVWVCVLDVFEGGGCLSVDERTWVHVT